MRKILLPFFLILCFSVHGQRDPASLVNPFIGTGGHGHTYPGASLPFGMMQLSPDTRMADWDGSSGYHYSDSVIYGFSHTHLSGTGIPDYCDVLFMPFTGEVSWNPSQYRSAFSHADEKAEPGYYEVLLDKDGIRAQLSTSYRSGLHQYTFPAGATPRLLIDLKHRDQVLDAFFEKINDHEIRGYRKSRSWAQDQTVYFYVQFEQPITGLVLAENDQPVMAKSRQGKNLKAALSFPKTTSVLRCRIGISGVSMEGAKKNLESEIKHWGLNRLRTTARSVWNRELNKIQISGGSRDEQTIFYTALYHTFLVPNIFQDVDGQYRGTDLKVHRADGFTNYTVFSLWDTYRAYHPLMNLINRKRTGDWLRTFMAQYEHGGMLPVWELAGNETFCMIGYHSVPVITDAWQKGIRTIDPAKALQAMRSYAESNRCGLGDYRKLGYISNDREHESASKTLEYAYDDWCIAQFAKMTGNQKVYLDYLQRAQNYKNMFDPSSRHMRGKVQASWHTPFDPREINNFFTEGNSWQYSFAVPQDIRGLIQLHGGPDAFAAKLDELFTTSTQTTGRQQSDVTGLIGQYAHGNEPSHHMAYLFNYVHRPWRTQELIQKICSEFYLNAPDGLIGNEDCGQMSAWYILTAMGVYPVAPGSDQYVIGMPQFDEMTVNLENGKKLVIRARNRKSGTNYISTLKLNGRNHPKTYVRYSDIAQGGILEFSLSPEADKTKMAGWEVPSSFISDELIVPDPYFDVANPRFRDHLDVRLASIDREAVIHFTINGGEEKRYSGPFRLDSSATLSAYALHKGKKSKTVQQDFFRIPTDRSVSVLSKVNPMYTAGGPDALIDGIMGNSNWRTGGWQGYYDQDFEAVVDLKSERPVRYAGVHVLQDVSPWILFPRELIISASSNGRDFTEIGRVVNREEQNGDTARVMELGTSVGEVTARFIRVRAVNGGKLPSWHESAGSPSHLFIDEIIVR